MDFLDSLNPVKWLEKGADWLGFGNGDQVDDAVDTMEGNRGLWQQNANANRELLDQYMQKVQGMDNPTQQYQQAMEDYKNIGAYNPQTFKYEGNVQDFVNPAMNMRVKTAQDAITKSQANAGNMFSSDYLNQLNAKAQAIASEEADKAYDRMNQDRQMALNEFNANAGQQLNAYNSQANMYQNLMNQLGQNYNQYNQNQYNALGDYYGGLVNSNNAMTEGMTNLNSSIANAQMGKQSGIASMLNTAGNLAGGIVGLNKLGKKE